MDREDFSFPVELRLRLPAQFKQVFADPVKSTDRYFTLLAINNDLDHPRLGLAIAKKNIKKAVTRNLLKRTIREQFRLQQQLLTHIDIVVLARRDAGSASPEELRKSLEKHWLRISRRSQEVIETNYQHA